MTELIEISPSVPMPEIRIPSGISGVLQDFLINVFFWIFDSRTSEEKASDEQFDKRHNESIALYKNQGDITQMSQSEYNYQIAEAEAHWQKWGQT